MKVYGSVFLILAAACSRGTPAPTGSATPDSVGAPKATAPNASASPSAAADTKPAPAMGDGGAGGGGANAFGLALYQKLKESSGNLTISPTSVSIALAMTCGGARGPTATELEKALGYACSGPAGIKTSSALASGLAQPAGVKLAMANRLFGDKSYEFKQPYADATKSAFGAPLEPVDFRGAPEPSRVRINTWVEEKTEQRVKSLVPQGAVDKTTKLALVNAIYFLGDWEKQFDKSKTSPGPFSLLGGTRVDVPLMHNTDAFAYAEDDGVSVVELPYVGKSMSMVLFVPKDAASFAKVEASLDGASAERMIAKLSPRQVALAMPKFTLAPPLSLRLADPLRKMGVVTLFSEADLTDIADPKDKSQRIAVSEVFHKTFVKVDEKGTEAAAASAVLAGPGGAAPQAVKLDVDRPFLFAIRHRVTGALVFFGRVVDPRTS